MKKKQKQQTVQTPNNQDHLEVYPERKQVSAFPERRFIKTNRMLTILAIINLACILAGAGIFSYLAQSVDLRMQDSKKIYLFQINTEEKTLKPAEYHKIKEPALKFIVEQSLRDYIEVRHKGVNNLDIMNAKLLDDESQKDDDDEKDIVKDRIIARLSSPAVFKQFEKEHYALLNRITTNKIEREVHIYNLHLLRNNLWTAVVETFDFPQEHSLCNNCMDNSFQCIQCKIKNRLHQERRRIWIQVSFNAPLPKDKNEINLNPFRIQIEGYYQGYMPTTPSSTTWDLPPELKPDLPEI
ncbi:MAG: hypothetical protein E7021_01370 [Alphaproteobacteria bacterium]|nr:hypothetical protein [Alphaproteobacteria bacterium]